MGKQFLRLRDGVHRVVDNHPVARCLRRRLRNPLLTTYFHMREGHWVVASWISKKYKLVVEHAPFGGRSGFTPRDAIEATALQLCKQTSLILGALREAAWRECSDEICKAQDEHDEHLATREWLRRHARKHCRDHPIWDFW